MPLVILFHQAVLYAHIVLFSLALAAVLREDLRILQCDRIDWQSLLRTARLVKWLLGGLWLTGVLLIALNVGTDLSLLAKNSKLLAKILVVLTLTANGMLLHYVALPRLSAADQDFKTLATLAVMLGAISTASWLYATFVGAASLLATYLTLYDFVAMYLLVITAAVAVAIIFLRDGIEVVLRLQGSRTSSHAEMYVTPAAQDVQQARSDYLARKGLPFLPTARS